MKTNGVRWLRAALGRLNKPVLLVLLVCLVLVALNIIVAQQNRAYDSDDVSWQTTLMSWRPFSGQQAYVGAKDNFIVNLPFIVIADTLVGSGRTQLLLASLMMALANFTLFYLASLYFMRRAKVELGYRSLFPFVWLASFGFGLSSLFLNTVWRDYEIGMSFVCYALACMYYFDDTWRYKRLPFKLLGLPFLFICGCFVLSDPYFFYFTVAPISLFFLVQYFLKNIPRRKVLTVLLLSSSTWVLSKVLTYVITRVGLVEPTGNWTFQGLGKIGPAFTQLIGSVDDIFGAGFSLLSIANLLMLLLIAGLILKELWPRRLTDKLKRSSSNTWLVFFSALALLIAAGSFAVDEGGIYVYRYLILGVYILILVLSLSTQLLKSWLRAVVVVVLLVATVSNLFSSYNSYKLAAQSISPNAANLQIVAAVRKLGLTKGYAGYWDGNINTYFARNIDFLPITCASGKTVPLRFLVNTALFTKQSESSFVLVDPDMNPPICSQGQIITQFGEPAQVVKVSGMAIFVYNYDLISRMPQ